MEKKYELTDETNEVYLRQILNFLIDNILTVYISSNQVLEKHLKCIADELPKQFIFRTLKALTHCMLDAYNGFVGCSYAIQYPLWGKRNDGLCTVFFSTRHPLLDVNEKHLTA
ncbi:hypothetical protein [Bartonella henselae]|uniref:Uncharacterized protein n=1 Tax=Bartonella henselae TaxID=38323 RepID=X5M677_BARHN|nr:hypothetical protein [Bartonella henselae]OLL41383.1 hypothetical protein AT244_04590 [Bartonella henselae]OLL44630.1 hypothetical protein AT245_07795 [Bartonella henselae]OLL54104.1 hypothetical protein AT240_02220 [Bartonella henselae]CDO46373.1 hypothetical protein BM1374165_00350 [Bartonella henselae]